MNASSTAGGRPQPRPGDRVRVIMWGYGVPQWACGFTGEVVGAGPRNLHVALGPTSFDSAGRIVRGRPEQFQPVTT